MWIAYAMDRRGEHHDEMWDEQDGFFYDLLRLPDGQAMRLKTRSMVGLLPLVRIDGIRCRRRRAASRSCMAMIAQFRTRHPELASQVAPTDEGFIGYKGRRLLSILNKQKLERVLAYMLDENEFLGPYGIRALSRYHLDHPFVFHVGGQEIQSSVPAWRIGYRHVRRQLQLARPGLDAGQCAADPGALEPVRVLRD